MAEREEELKNLLMRVKEESEKSQLKINIKNTHIMVSDPIHYFRANRKGKGRSSDRLPLIGL